MMTSKGCVQRGLTLFFPILLACSLILFSHPSLTAGQSGDTGASDRARILIHLLDYMAADYPVAVKNGQIINEMEYREMQEFATSIDSLYHTLPDRVRDQSTATASTIDTLRWLVDDKVEPQHIATTAFRIKQDIIAQTGLTVAPKTWPNIQQGRKIFVRKCASCHGQNGRGNGPLAENLTPPPTNFHEDGRMQKISPLQAYNTIQLGVEGTSMQAYTNLSDRQVWNLAFYIKSLRFKDDSLNALNEEAVEQVLDETGLSLADVARRNDNQLSNTIAEKSSEGKTRQVLKSIRQYNPEKAGMKYISKTRSLLEQAKSEYSKGAYEAAYKTSISAYLEGVEPIEAQLRAQDRQLVSQLENQMMTLRSLIQNRKGEEKIADHITTIESSLNKAGTVLDETESSPWLSFLLSASILLREGLEAFLIIITILGVLTSLKAGDKKKWIHLGWISAVLVGLASWFFTDWLLAFGANWRELMEGGLSLLAVGILIYVGFWMHRNSEVEQWKKFINSEIREKLQGGNLLGLSVIAFIAVFREAFESVIFLSAISIEAGPGGDTAIGMGAITAFLLLAVIGYAMLKLTVKVPIRSIFRYGSYAIGFFALIMVGQGIHAVQETGWISSTPTKIPINASIVGLYPTVETLLAQLVTFLLLMGLWKYSKIKQ